MRQKKELNLERESLFGPLLPNSKHVQIILKQQLFVCLFKGMLNPDSVLLMLLLPSVKHLILAIRMSLLNAVLHFSRSHLVICGLAKCESRLEKPFCNASSEMPEGTGGRGQGGVYWKRLCAFLLLLQTLHCPYNCHYIRK